MKKATYRLTIEFDNGDKLSIGGLTQTRAYDKLKMWEERDWSQRPLVGDPPSAEYRMVTRWKIETAWQGITE
jgi:hypothetical protein